MLDKFEANSFYNLLLRSSLPLLGGSIFHNSAVKKLGEFVQRISAAMSEVLYSDHPVVWGKDHHFNNPLQKRQRVNPLPFRPSAGPSFHSGEPSSNYISSHGKKIRGVGGDG